jgi:hypothetical protein
MESDDAYSRIKKTYRIARAARAMSTRSGRCRGVVLVLYWVTFICIPSFADVAWADPAMGGTGSC